MLAVFAIPAHLSRLAAIKCANSSGELGWVWLPICAGIPIVLALGTIWLKNSTRFVPSVLIKKLTPVTLPSGRLRLATTPALIGSEPVTKTIGIVEVAALAASAVG